jgi:transcriptional regulator with XRE-family HTH domain
METERATNVRFGKRFREARNKKKWSQTETAKRLGQLGVRAYPSTIAKIEAGDRPVKLAELAAIAEMFGVSIDVLLRRGVKPRSDRVHALTTVVDTALRASAEIAGIVAAVRDRVDDLAAFDDLPAGPPLIAGWERARDLLIDTDDVLTDVMRVARGAVGEEMKAK